MIIIMDIELTSEWAFLNSLYTEVIYRFQFSNAEIAHNQRCHSEGRS